VKAIILALFFIVFSYEAEAQTFSDPHEYCRAVGTIDSPFDDDRYRGPKATERMASVFGEKLKNMKVVQGGGAIFYTVTWRCAKGEVFACWEPNTPQCGLADKNRKPTSSMVEYCQQNPNSGIPAAITGHMIIFEWNCVGKKPVAGRQFMQVDSEGYAIGLWKRVPR